MFKWCATFNILHSEYISDFQTETLMDQNTTYLEGSSQVPRVKALFILLEIQVMFAASKLFIFHCIWLFCGGNLSFPEGLAIDVN